MSSLQVLRCPVQTYHWGRPGERSLVGRLALRGGHMADISDTTPYAELWMGTHPTKPSLLADGKPLADMKGAHDLSFLLKILSVETALSIQAHPDKALAAELRATTPEHYPDDNHKPEMAIALTEFEVLCRFRPLEDIDAFVSGVPELRQVIGPSPIQTKEELRTAFNALMTSPANVFQPQLENLVARLANGDASGVIPPNLCDVVLRVAKQYPNDVGLFCMFFLNYLTLQPGEALFLAANEPHAYLRGDCVECMATSDNVVRAGLTPKFRDVNTLVNMLTYESTRDVRFKPERIDEQVSRFRPPVDDFAVMQIRLGAADEEPRKMQPTDSAGSICIVVEGFGQLISNGSKLDVRQGTVVYIPPASEVSVQGELLLFQAYTP
ncbi:mannose-6-phosphate isomerase-like [Tropilaelaps mercedesae]|uniref:mannose-6-phosphate isomerase n=1 Tax=Tropilaelaps mercedesae TaxID=418985 RepID=A0A1V9X979_9ACAR|nr:mannose-6-phosphate isomerase-like [Tropilaelaps mercedesae]